MNNKRFGITFSTGSDRFYYYDSGTGKVVECNEQEAGFIDKILNDQLSLKQAFALNKEFEEFVENENLFACPEDRPFSVPSIQEFKLAVEGSCEQVVLELTEKCNLRCSYCIYHPHHPEHRGFSNKNMTFEIAKASIDYLLKDYKGDEFGLTFYGGEPLCNFSVMKKSIEYIRNEYSDVKFSVGFTTNLVLLTQEMAEYFATLEDIDIMCSIDGSKEFHDMYRKDITGKGSFDRAMRGFEILREIFYKPEKKRTLSINCVLTPPYSKDKLKTINDFFKKTLKIPDDITCNYAYLDMGDMDFEQNNLIVYEDDDKVLESSPIEEWTANDFIEKKGESSYLDFLTKDLSRIANRLRTTNEIIKEVFLHGNCIPGKRRLYVTVDGEFRVCEKIGNSPKLGDYKTGYDYERNYELYIKKYSEFFRPICNECWARLLCSICYESTMEGTGDTPYVAGKLCDGSRRIIKDMLVNYYRLFEQDRETLKAVLAKYEYS